MLIKWLKAGGNVGIHGRLPISSTFPLFTRAFANEQMPQTVPVQEGETTFP